MAKAEEAYNHYWIAVYQQLTTKKDKRLAYC